MNDYFQTLMDYSMWLLNQYFEKHPFTELVKVPVKSDKQNG